jgi:maltose/moltooligosaccharide transporter
VPLWQYKSPRKKNTSNDRLLAVEVGGGLMILAALICYLFVREKRSEQVDETLTTKLEILEERSV